MYCSVYVVINIFIGNFIYNQINNKNKNKNINVSNSNGINSNYQDAVAFDLNAYRQQLNESDNPYRNKDVAMHLGTA